MAEMVCFSCHKKYSFVDRVSLREECPHCHADGHVCMNCEFYDTKAYNECREPQAERIMTKDRNNRCDYFSVNQKGLGAASSKDHLRAAAEALFRKK